MKLRALMEAYQTLWMFESHHHQRLAWKDAQEMRIARIRAGQQAAAQLRSMLVANPSGQLGGARLDDPAGLARSGLL